MANPNETVARARKAMGGFPQRERRPVSAFVEWVSVQARAGRRFATIDAALAAYENETKERA
jgi:hypothetical protein